MQLKKIGVNTLCAHVGEIKDEQFHGAISPLYMSSSYAYEDVDVKRYPRYYNTPNQEALGKKIAALEHCEAGMVFGSGMAAISTALLAFLKQGDHVVVQKTIYGGAYNFITKEFPKYGIDFDFTDGFNENDFRSKIKSNTKVIYIETPSNPLMELTDLEMISEIAKEHQLISMIDNTFASPINQNPGDFGIDIMIHSATKYMGGHSDICAGAIATSKEYMNIIWQEGINLGGSLSDYTVWLLERSMKTMGLRVKAHNRNAKKVAKWLVTHPLIKKVHYPGLRTHPDYALAKKQMKGYTGMLSFELIPTIDADAFVKALILIKPSMSLAGVESTIVSPAKTSHALLSKEERLQRGIEDGLLRLSVGIEDKKDLIADLEQAFESVSKKQLQNK
ncbi:MAG TPA: PLP-dependent aspartate aminotransferase family protein [Flavobacteriaceae bacterium]|nr:PLP-dependent transferase [Flavobacteriaceae bacterium]MCB9213717.1 PLP-dependent transferase [Alteromonas sp.]HPF11911.1 PLP-dependent aspartate aminotransferase family protein [Flavobacteriaceae bacterium]HQU21905.1 PLP-dependent aspartate aminotransferase family protein [Flavobacteriaceae bacterium]HQU65457.1 PLP-dependent aspartate aminotransferase family protein [Flavobacteriaceae bacterium]